MAVQAQHPANAFAPDFRPRIQMGSYFLDDYQILQGPQPGAVGAPVVFNDAAAAFSNPQSELTCIAAAPVSVSKKRVREEPPLAAALPTAPMSFAYPNLAAHDLARLVDSAGTSTSGRPSSSAVVQDLVPLLYNQSLEIDALVYLQNERLRMALEQAQKRQCRALLSAVELQIVSKLKEKDAELESVNRKNAELEEKIRQMSAENQIWFNVAKNNEAIVSSLRSSLEQVLSQGAAAFGDCSPAMEGYGDSDGAAADPADDAQSCCFEGHTERTGATAVKKQAAAGWRRKCRGCGEKDVSVLVLPCRHLCLCKDCESLADTCPVCHVSKNACLQISLS